MKIETFEKLIEGAIYSGTHSNELTYSMALEEEKNLSVHNLRYGMCVNAVHNMYELVFEKLESVIDVDGLISIIYFMIQDELEVDYIVDGNPLGVIYPVGDKDHILYKHYMVTRYLFTKVLLGTDWDSYENLDNNKVVLFIKK